MRGPEFDPSKKREKSLIADHGSSSWSAWFIGKNKMEEGHEVNYGSQEAQREKRSQEKAYCLQGHSLVTHFQEGPTSKKNNQLLNSSIPEQRAPRI